MLWQSSMTLKSHIRIINFMNCIEKFIYRNEKVEKLNDKMTCISAIKP